MGRASRRLAEEVFDVRLVNQIILNAMHVPSRRAEQTIVSVPCPQAAGA
jgi:hypothetical protein